MQRTLGFRIEGANRVDLVVQQLDAIRLAAAHRKDVEQRTANGVITRVEHLRYVTITSGFQTTFFRVQIETLAQLHLQGIAADEGHRREPLHQGRHRDDQHPARGARQAIQRRHALRHDVLMRTENVVGQGFPIREMQHRQIARKHPQLGFQRLRGKRIAGDHHQQPSMLRRRRSHRQSQRRPTLRSPPPRTLLPFARQRRAQQTAHNHHTGGTKKGVEFSRRVTHLRASSQRAEL